MGLVLFLCFLFLWLLRAEDSEKGKFSFAAYGRAPQRGRSLSISIAHPLTAIHEPTVIAKASMDALDVFALVVLLVIAVSIVGTALVLAALPGRIAAQRGHLQADAIRICGWLGLLTLGILWPIALIWAYLKPLRGNALSAGAPSTREPAPREVK